MSTMFRQEQRSLPRSMITLLNYCRGHNREPLTQPLERVFRLPKFNAVSHQCLLCKSTLDSIASTFNKNSVKEHFSFPGATSKYHVIASSHTLKINWTRKKYEKYEKQKKNLLSLNYRWTDTKSQQLLGRHVIVYTWWPLSSAYTLKTPQRKAFYLFMHKILNKMIFLSASRFAIF